MNRDSLIASRISVGRMPGILNPGFTIDGLVPGLNILYGPNGIGKSTTAAALRALLWPATAPPVAQATATLRVGDAVTELDLAANKVTASGSSLPPLPPQDAADRYHLAFHQLIVSSEGRFAEQVQREMSGGYDIQAAAEALGYRRAQSRNQKESVVHEKLSSYKEQERRQEELLQNASGLARLEEDLAQARQLSGETALLNGAIAFHDARAQRRACVARARAFPLGVRRIAGDELRRVDESAEAQANQRRQLADALRRRREAQQGRIEASLPRGGIAPSALQELSTLVQEFRSARQALEHAGDSFGVATTSEKLARDRIATGLTLEHLKALDADGLAEIANLSERGERLRDEWGALNALRKLLGDGKATEPVEPQRNAQFLLTQWLSTPTSSVAAPDLTPLIVVSLSGLVAIVALTLQGHPLWLLLLVPIAVALARAWRPTQAGPDGRQAIEAQYKALQVAPPAAWKATDVQERLNQLLAELAQHAVDEDKTKRWAPHVDQFEVCRQQVEAFGHERHALIQNYGIAPELASTLGSRLYVWCAALVEWRAASAAVAQAETERDAKSRAATAKLAQLKTRLAPYGHLPFTTPAQAESMLADLKERQNHLAIAQDKLAESTNSIRYTIENLRLEQHKTEEIYHEARLPLGARAALASAVAKQRDYLEARKAMNTAKGATRDRRRELLLNRPELLNWNLEQLQERLGQATEAADRAQQLAEQRTQIRTRVEEAQKSTAVEAAYAEWQTALAALEDARDAEYGPVAGLCLTEYTRQQTHEWDRPAVFRTADKIFGSITNGRYQLDFNADDPPAFCAIDTSSGLRLTLDQLSSGTRVQILIAVRLGFIESQEEGVRLPLVVDEVLANSDDVRARAVVEALVALCRQGRQIFYLTAQADELDKWSALLEDAEDVPFKIVDMAAVRLQSGIQRIPSSAGATKPADVPAPNGDDLAAYALRLQAPRFDPQQEVGSTDLCDLCDSPATVHILRERGLLTWGQTYRMLADLAGSFVDGAEAKRMAARAQVLERLIPAWRQGRPPILEYYRVQQSGAVTPAFDEAARELLTAVGGSPSLFIDGLRNKAIKGFRENQIEKLMKFLFDNQLMDELPKLTAEQLVEQGAQAAREAIVQGVLTLHDVERLVALLPL